ncbi:hypothetical protein [Streptomyces sp. NPDC049813]|uniref:hypothetical protein n=1 Tax=Streptomyces sp. NPDC049813 TaxID=3365597 RepID=UPI0037A56327
MTEDRRIRTLVVPTPTAAVVVLDRHLTIRSWNDGAYDLWGLRPDETLNHPFFTLEFGLPTRHLRTVVEECVTTGRCGAPVTLDAVDRHGHRIGCAVLCSPFDVHPGGAVLLMTKTRGASTA